MSEDTSKYTQRPKLDGNKTEVFRVYYDKNSTTFDEFLLMEHFSLIHAAQKKWKIFHAFPSIFMDPYIICKN